MASGPITSWQINGETVETLTEFISLSSKITADGDCSHDIKRCLFLRKRTVTNLNSTLKRKNITLLTKVHIVKAMVFPVVMHGWSSWKTTRPFRYDLNQISYDYTVEGRNRFKGLDLIECLMNYGLRFMTLYSRQGSRPSPWKRNAKKQNGCLRWPYK